MLSTNMIKPGDVFMLHDNQYQQRRKGKIDTKTKTIRYDRPCIILSVLKNQSLATVIPLTTKNNSYHVTYPIQIEKNKISYAILSQVTTVDTSNLSYFIGELKQYVFEDIKDKYRKYFENNDETVHREISRKFNALDVYRIFPYRFYRQYSTNKYFLALRTTLGTIIMIPVSPTYIDGISAIKDTESNLCVIGKYSLDELELIYPSTNHHFSDYTSVCYEFNQCVRDNIKNKLYELYGINIISNNYEDSTEIETIAISETFGLGFDFINGKHMLDTIVAKQYELEKFIETPTKYLDSYISSLNKTYDTKKLFSIRSVLIFYVLQKLDVLKTDPRCLNYIRRYYPEYMEGAVFCYKDAFTHVLPGKIFDGKLFYKSFNQNSVYWLNNYCKEKGWK